MNIATVGIGSLIIMHRSCKMVEKNILEGEESVFLILLYLLLLSEFIRNNNKQNRTWRPRTENGEKRRT